MYPREERGAGGKGIERSFAIMGSQSQQKRLGLELGKRVSKCPVGATLSPGPIPVGSLTFRCLPTVDQRLTHGRRRGKQPARPPDTLDPRRANEPVSPAICHATPPTIVLILPLHPLSLAASVVSARQTDPCSQSAEAIHRHPLQLATIPCMISACHGPCPWTPPLSMFHPQPPFRPKRALIWFCLSTFLPLPPTTLAVRPCRFNRPSRTHMVQQARPSACPCLLAKFGLARPSHLHP
jgi:hypothetical protein